MTPAIPRVAVAFLRVVQMDDPSAELVRTAHCINCFGPVFSELVITGLDHGSMAFQFQLMADAVALVRSKEELETFGSKVGIRQSEAFAIHRMYRWICKKASHSLEIAD
jgi:hypothetical protein